MPLRPTDADPEREQAITAARADLSAALSGLSRACNEAARACNSKRGTPDMPAVYGAASRVRRAEEALDLAVLDRDTAAGADA